MTVQGNPGEKIYVTCSNCKKKGYFIMPIHKTESDSISIKISGLTKIYKDVRAVDNISFNVHNGEIYGFLGPNGAGKTTTIKAMLGLIHVNSGTIKINGFDMNKDNIKAKEKIGYLPEKVSFYENLTPIQTLNFFCELRSVDKSVVPSLIKEVGLEDAMNRKVGTFSKGMVQLLGIAQAMIGNPSIYILDEPTVGLDARWVRYIREKIKMLNEHGATVIFSSHILSEVDKVCDRIGIIRNGNLVALEDVEALKEKMGKIIKVKIKEKPEKFNGPENLKIKNGWIEFVTNDDIDYWIKMLSKYTILDLVINEFSLEDIFIHYYEGQT